jgi:hypothetical protein
MRKIIFSLILVLGALLVPAAAQGPTDGPIQSGYVIVTPSVSTLGFTVFESFGERRGTDVTQAGVLAADMTTNAMLFVTSSGRLSRNLAVAIANPGATDANVTLTLRNDLGVVIATKTVTVKGKNQIAEFITEMFTGVPAVPQEFTGSLAITSGTPVAAIGLRFRGQNFSTVPVTSLSPSSSVPIVTPGIGGNGAVVLPQFATGGGWESEIVIANFGSTSLNVRVDIFKQDGGPLLANLNGLTRSSITNITIPAFGIFILSPKDSKGDSDF